jgi:hypothetical protein
MTVRWGQLSSIKFDPSSPGQPHASRSVEAHACPRGIPFQSLARRPEITTTICSAVPLPLETGKLLTKMRTRTLYIISYEEMKNCIKLLA